MPFTGIRHSTNDYRVVFHRILPQQCCIGAHALARWTHSVFCAFTFPTLVLFHQRLLDRMAYALHWCPPFNQWSLYSVSPHSAPAESCRRLYSSTGRRTAPFEPMAFPTLAFFQQWLLDRMAYALRWYPAFNQWSPYSVSPHSVPAESCRRLCSSPVDAQYLSRLWRSYTGFLPAAVTGSNDLCPSLLSGIQPMVTVQCFTAFCPGRVV